MENVVQLVEEYGDMILRIAFTYVKCVQDAEDILQDVLIKYIEKKPGFENDEHRKAWFIRVTINHSKNLLKAPWKRLRSDWSEQPYFQNVGEDPEVLKAVLALPDRYRDVIHLFYYEEYTGDEIAAILGKNPSTVRSLLKRGRQLLKKSLKEEYGYEEAI